ncbi:basal cell adhesion molecule-like isoform X2 [Pristis pectinata]|uniref:basal cell adhesion molecule-like isoform X2 n=1 Tax=Pristis pectinata TaxID=685728 RepID=UPI00223D9CA2|nr:basal cell adhesion molecule-like isoform X2 [Pristis pectinata]
MALLAEIFLLVTAAAGVLGSVEVSLPEQVDAEVTHSVTIPCTHTITGSHGNVMVEWFVLNKNGDRERIAYKDQTSSVVDPGTGFTDRVSVDGDFGLTISPVLLQDEQSFLCQVIAGAAGSHEGKTELKVYDSPEQPEVTSNLAILSVTEQLPSEIGSCTSRNGYPAPSVVWYKDGAPLDTITTHHRHMYMTPRVVKETSGLYTVSSQLYLKLEKKDKDSEFWCQVRYRGVGGEERRLDSERFTISLHYHTEHMTFNLASNTDIKEGEDVRMKCEADGFPQPEYILYRVVGEEEQELETSKDGWFMLKHVRRNDSGTYRCEALDFDAPEDVELRKDISIFVHYLQPPELTTKSPLTVQLGQDVEVSCSSHGSATPKIIWRKGKDHLSHSGTLSLRKVGYKSSGTYVCEASVPSVRGLVRTRQLKVLVEGKPSMETGRLEVTVGREGDRVTLTCTSSGHPSPKIAWSVDKQPVVSSSDQAVVSKVSLPVTAALVQTGVSCNASNKYGWSQRHFRLSVVPPTTETPVTSGGSQESGGGGVVVVVVVVICVLLLLLVLGLLFCLHKRGKLHCGKSEKKDTVNTEVRNDDIVVEMKSGQSAETSGLLGVNMEKGPRPDRR